MAVIIFMAGETVRRQTGIFFIPGTFSWQHYGQMFGKVAAVARSRFVFSRQRKVCFPVVVKRRLAPFYRVVAVVTFFAEDTAMRIVDLVTVDAGFRGVFVFLVDMTGRAAGIFVRTLQRKIGFLVVKPGLFPAGCGMAAATLFTLFAIVHISFLVTAVALDRCIGIFFFRFMAAVTCGFFMQAFQFEVCLEMIEGRCVQQDYVGTSSYMFSVAVFTVVLLSHRQTAMEAGFIADIFRDVFMCMTVRTQLCLSALIGGVMAVITLLFVFLM